MINKLKNKFWKKIDLRFNQLKSQQHNNAQIQFNYNQLQNLINEPFFVPMTTWSMSPSTILHVLNDISINNRLNVIEFGSGASTFYIAKLIKQYSLKTKFFSVESDEEWMNQLYNQLKLYNLEDFVELIFAPIVEVPKSLSYKGQKTWYDTKILSTKLAYLETVDLILVDGPIGKSTPFARYSAIPFLAEKISEDFTVFLDDIHRKQEQEIIKQWSKQLDGNPRCIERYAYLSLRESLGAQPFQLH